MRFHDVFRNNVGIARPNQPLPDRNPDTEPRNKNQHRSKLGRLGFRQIASNKEGLHDDTERREGCTGVERFRRGYLEPWSGRGRTLSWSGRYPCLLSVIILNTDARFRYGALTLAQ